MNTITATLEATPSARQWAAIGMHPHNGICVPLFSLHSQQSTGIGEYTDLIPLLTWCKEVGLDVVQLLPLNDTGHESSPYSALSAFALNPLHLGLTALPHFAENDRLMSMQHETQKLNCSQRIDYKRLCPQRENILREYFGLYGNEIIESTEYKQFLGENLWVIGYAIYKAIKASNNWLSWEQWPEDLRTPSFETLSWLRNSHDAEITYHQCLQFLCFKQMAQVKKHAESLNVFIKGDIPILINRDSADVWLHRSLFNLEASAGAPPDAYSSEGQNWGFPIYNWTEIENQDYAWWKERLVVASRCYHLYRIDHIVGFYRIWAIAQGKKALEGEFIPADNKSWVGHGEKIMRMMLESSPMLPIGEDLGVVPDEVRANMASLGICGTKVMRWERFWKSDDKRFLFPNEYPLLSMTTLSTHDSTPTAVWWEEDFVEAKEYAQQHGWGYQTPLSDKLKFAILYDSHHTGSIFHINLLNEYLMLFPELSWSNPKDERINTPGIVSDLNWTYRFRPSVEEICSSQPLANLIEDVARQ